MSKKALLPQSRHHILVYDEDWEFLEQNYGKYSANAMVGVSGAIRQIIHQKVLGLKAMIEEERNRAAAQRTTTSTATSTVGGQ